MHTNAHTQVHRYTRARTHAYTRTHNICDHKSTLDSVMQVPRRNHPRKRYSRVRITSNKKRKGCHPVIL